MKLSFRGRILTYTLGFIALSTILISWVSYQIAKQALLQSVELSQVQTVDNTTAQMNQWLEERQLEQSSLANQKLVQTAIQDTVMGKSARKSIGTEFERLLAKNSLYDFIFLCDITGAILTSSDSNVVDVLNVNEGAFFQKAKAGQTAISEVFANKKTQQPVFVIASPVVESNQVVGVLAAVANLPKLTAKYLDSAKLQTNAYIFMVDRNGTTIAHPDKSRILKDNMSQFEWAKPMMQNNSGRISYVWLGVEKELAFKTCEQSGWRIAITTPAASLVAPARKVGYWSLCIGVICLGLTSLIIVLVVRSVTAPLNRLLHALNDSAVLVSSGSGQISGSSHSLAEGASEQAASLEETASSLEEMSGMTRNNAQNTRRANELTSQARAAAENGAAGMLQMSSAMDAIKSSSDDIAKIIKTIDEIAFQTNILALNAAVEAARAGEAGLGFAVVADEVRNLAQRSAQAAKETAGKIEGAIQRTAQGVEISSRVVQGLQDIVAKVKQVDGLVAEVVAASQEQAQGIEQINHAVSEMDKVTQANAANAEQSASAAAELHSRADMLMSAVTELDQLVNGAQQSGDDSRGGQQAGPARASHASIVSTNNHRPAPTPQRALTKVGFKPRTESAKAGHASLASQAEWAEVPSTESDELIRWDPQVMSTGVASVDAQHQELIGMLNQLHRSCLQGIGKAELRKTLDFLGQYVVKHFAHEEQVMAQLFCPAQEANKQAHKKFIADYTALVKEVEQSGENTRQLLQLKGMAAGWLKEHICKVDTQLQTVAGKSSFSF